MIPVLKNYDYNQRLKACSLPTLRYRRIRGYMIETYKKTGIYDVEVTHKLYPAHSLVTRGNDLRLLKGCAKYDLRKFYFTNRIVNLWNSLPNNVMLSESLNVFKSRLDKFWRNQDVVYDYRADIEETKNRS